jgi:hypothetical protein
LRTLITGGKSAQALKLLKAFSGDQVILGDYGDMPAFVSAQYQQADLGPRNDDTIAHNLLNACLDQEADRLLPIYDFELEAVIKSAVLFEEFNIHVLLPDSAGFPVYFTAPPGDKKNWAVFDQGQLVFSTLLDSDLLKGGEKLNLNGAFYITEDENGIHPSLFMIS